MAHSKFKPEYTKQAYKLCLLGATGQELADFFEVNIDTITEWQHVYPEFRAALVDGRIKADAEVASKLYENAIGYNWVEEEAIKLKAGANEEKVEVVKLNKSTPPDTRAQQYWLNNRARTVWKGTQDINLSGKVEIKDIDTPEARLEMARQIAFLLCAGDPEPDKID